MPMSADHIHKIICSHTPIYNYMNAQNSQLLSQGRHPEAQIRWLTNIGCVRLILAYTQNTQSGVAMI